MARSRPPRLVHEACDDFEDTPRGARRRHRRAMPTRSPGRAVGVSRRAASRRSRPPNSVWAASRSIGVVGGSGAGATVATAVARTGAVGSPGEQALSKSTAVSSTDKRTGLLRAGCSSGPRQGACKWRNSRVSTSRAACGPGQQHAPNGNERLRWRPVAVRARSRTYERRPPRPPAHDCWLGNLVALPGWCRLGLDAGGCQGAQSVSGGTGVT